MATCPSPTIESNTSGLRIAEETCIGQLPGTDGEDAVWEMLEPNSYSEFGGNNTLTPRTPINDSRQRKKGRVTNRTATAGFNQDITGSNLEKILQGYVFADVRTKASYTSTAALSVTTSGAFPRIVATTGIDFTTLGLIPGEYIYIGDDLAASRFNSAVNNGFKRVRAVGALYLELDKSEEPMVVEASKAGIVLHFGKVLKNEKRPLIKRRTYNLERTFETADGTGLQAEYIEGAVPNQATINLPVSALANVDFTFMGLNHAPYEESEGIKPGTRPALAEAEAFDTSSDLQQLRLTYASGPKEGLPLFGHASEATLVINNTLSPVQALTVLGALEINKGTFAVSGNITAFFQDMAAIKAIQSNADISFDAIFVQGEKGVVIDMPLVAFGGGQLNVALDQPVTLPLSQEAATGAKISADLDHTVLFTFFENLPDLASA